MKLDAGSIPLSYTKTYTIFVEPGRNLEYFLFSRLVIIYAYLIVDWPSTALSIWAESLECVFGLSEKNGVLYTSTACCHLPYFVAFCFLVAFLLIL